MATTRQLTVIMFTDIVGYTAVMGKNSAKALELLRVSKEIQKPLVEKYNGKWLKEIGDGVMLQFNTALDAVNCAVEIQRSSRADFEADFRIGIHLGDITIEDGDIFGDGVNVAARLESIADPGGIYISESVEKSIRGQTDIQAKYLGELSLKNVDYGVRTYALQGVGLPVPSLQEEKQLSGRFWAEIKRRGVLRAGVTYILVALLLIVLSNEVETLPQWLLPALVAVLIIGLPIALYLAWNYERSPEGFVRTTSAESWQNPYRDARRKPFTSNLIIGVLMLIILAVYGYPRYINTSSSDSATKAVLSINDKSIAALPFRNLSDDQSNQYFCDGVLDGVLNNLSAIEDLRVISRTSIEKYRETTLQIPEIAKELHVSYLLEASVFKSGDRIRVTAQLLDASKDEHIWSDQYDRDISDVFTVMSEISKEVASEIKAVIRPEEEQRIDAIPTDNLEAYDLYLKGLQYDNDFFFRKEEQDLRLAIHFYKSALELDPGFFLAKVNLAWTYIHRSDILGEGIHLYDSALHVANDLLYQYPDRSELLSLLGNIYLLKGINKKEAKEMLIRAVRLNPNDPKAISKLSYYYALEENRVDISLILDQRASSVQPNNALHYHNQGWNWYNLNEHNKAEPLLLKALEIQPDYIEAIIILVYLNIESVADFEKGISFLLQGLSYNPHDLDIMHHLGQAYSWQGDFEESERYFLKIKEVVEQKDYTITRRTPWFPHRYAYTLWNLDRKEEARKYFQQQIDRDLSFLEDRVQSYSFYAYYDLAAVNAFLGNKEQAYYWLNEILENKSWAGSSHILADPLFDPIKKEDAFKEFVDTYKTRMEREVRHYEELKDLSFSEFLQRIDEPLPQYTDMLD